ncbi:probable G-protein coupled receptor Mth-like 8 [Teleopsis dalmanni]|uniref:probable G-protein coupled receptor Mth-like 8 n=1 Tax=Teleopsis dalmanni TaxID=139649 RepID=UPI0018CE3BA7|nr:probable G-protein coupled receptor Mth-like 8 [Teleopsis dalmanni]
MLKILLAIALCCATYTHAHQVESKYPCAFIDTANITGSFSHDTTNMSYIYEWMIIPRELVAAYDFIIQDGVRVPAERHLRACVCKLKPCIRFCCTQGQYYDVKNKTCIAVPDVVEPNMQQHIAISASNNSQISSNSSNSSNSINSSNNSSDKIAPLMDQSFMLIKQWNGTSRIVNTSTHFSVHIGSPCENMRLLKKNNQIVQWNLYENGSISHKNHLFSKHYCYTPYEKPNSVWEWQPLACAPEKLPFVLGVKEWTYAICLIIAVICMSIILFVHLLCTELRNTFYGVAIKCYALCIIIGYSLLAHLILNDPANMLKFSCSNIPCFALCFLVLSFFILTFISFNFYLNFHGVILTKLMFWLTFCPIVLLCVGWSFYVGFDYYQNKPIFGGDSCWFDPRNWSIMVYFYGPIFLSCVLSGFFYLLTLMRISERQEADVNKLIATIEENRFKSFWKFFGYTVVTWLVCMFSFVINYYRGEKTHINYAVCLFVALHGFGALYTLIGKNQQIQKFLRRIDEDVDDDDDEDLQPSSVRMTSF